MAFSDVFAGWQEAAHEHYKNVLQMQYEQFNKQREMYSKIASQPDVYGEQASGIAAQRALTPFLDEKGNINKLPKEDQNFTFQFQPPQPPAVTAPGTPGMSGTTDEGNPRYAQAEINPQTYQPPTPPPQTMNMGQPLPLEERMRRAAAESVAKSTGPFGIAGMRAAIPKMVKSSPVQGTDGRRYTEMLWQARNPTTGIMEQWTQRNEDPLPFFAPRSGPEVTVGELKTAVESGAYEMPWDQNGRPLDIYKLKDDEVLQHIGENRYLLKTQPTKIQNIGGYNVGFNPVGGSVTKNYGQAVSPAKPGSATTRNVLTRGPGGTTGTVDLQSITQPLPPPGPNMPSYPQNLTPQPRSGETAGFPNATIQNIQDAMNARGPLPPTSFGLTPPSPTMAPIPGQGAPAAPAPPPQAPLKPQAGAFKPVPGAGPGLTAEQLMDTDKKTEAYSNTAERAIGVLSYAPRMKSLIERAKLSIVTDPSGLLKIAIGNSVGLTPEEAKVAADYVSLSEDVNVLRGIYQATGFRGKEALEVLLGQRGNLLGNPQVFNNVLKNTLQSVISQMAPMVQTLKENGRPKTVTPGIVQAYKLLYGNKAQQQAESTGWVTPQ